MTFEYDITYETYNSYGDVIGSVEVCIEYKVTDWGCPARINYTENDHPAEPPEIEIIKVTTEASSETRVYVPATEEIDAWARNWAEENIDILVNEASR
jgi:hypothetical protein